MRILVIRPDRIGDVILSTPVFEAIKTALPESHLTVMVQENLLPILRNHPFIDELMIYRSKRHPSLVYAMRLALEIRAKKFDIAIVLQTHWILGLAVLLAGIPKRIGPLSKLHSYLFYNEGLRQNRSRV